MAWLSPVLWPFLRVLALFTSAPVFSMRVIPVRTRTGMARMENTGAAVNSASTRRNGHSTGDSQAMIWASVKVIKTPIQPRRVWIRWCGAGSPPAW